MRKEGKKIPRTEEGLPDLPPSDEDDTDPEAEALRDRYRWLDPWSVTGVESAIHACEFVDEPRFVPTQHELAKLAVYWQKVALFVLQLSEDRLSDDKHFAVLPYAYRRIAMIADYIGPEVVSEAIAPALRRDEAVRTGKPPEQGPPA
ncbi:MAG TPA: hypothetical protein VLE03_01270 [Nitrospiraceae bacterium]|nr:hypothetical protein [Nitrospiraceae bacterium]